MAGFHRARATQAEDVEGARQHRTVGARDVAQYGNALVGLGGEQALRRGKQDARLSLRTPYRCVLR
ncbi:hypothetical protein D0B32_02220 [Paraburkholderia sp. DHOC27]|nr:hypothetical protein D0B32_02220 [Paraburkholderia sp. DHOC27]